MTKERGNLPSKAIILAGGRGERMQPLSRYFPKPLLPILDKPLIVHHLERLEMTQVQEVAIVIEPKLGDILVRVINDKYDGNLEISFIVDSKYRGTGEGVYCGREFAEFSSFFLCLGDRYQEGTNIFRDFQSYLRRDTEALVAVAKVHPYNISQGKVLSGTSVRLDEETKTLAALLRFPPESEILGRWFLTGAFILWPSFWEILEKKREECGPEEKFSKTLVIGEMVKQGVQIGYIKEEGLAFNINTLRDLLRANFYLAKKRGIL